MVEVLRVLYKVEGKKYSVFVVFLFQTVYFVCSFDESLLLLLHNEHVLRIFTICGQAVQGIVFSFILKGFFLFLVVLKSF